MYGDQPATDGKLRLGRNQSRASGRFLAAAENAGDAVCLGQKSGVDDAETEADGCALDAAYDVGRTQYEQERDGVTHEDAAEKNVTQFASGCSHHRRVGVTQEHAQNLSISLTLTKAQDCVKLPNIFLVNNNNAYYNILHQWHC